MQSVKDGRMRLNEWLKSQNMTQTQFAASVGSTDPSISRIVAGQQWPSPALMTAIEAATDGQVTATDILATYNETQVKNEPVS